MDAETLALKTAIRIDANAATRAFHAYMGRMFDDWQQRREHYGRIVEIANDWKLTEYWRYCCEYWDADDDERARLLALPPESRPFNIEEDDGDYMKPLIDAYHDSVLSSEDIVAMCRLAQIE